MFEISVNSSPDSYTEQLKTDIANLEQEYGVETGAGRIKTEPDNQIKSKTPVLGQTLNPEWASDRRNYPSSKGQVAQQLPKFRSRLMGAAPNDAEQYNDAFRIPVGTNVGPELPPLSVPDNYLPNAPMQFTGYIWPSKGVLTSGYGRRWGRMHRGIDIAAPIGTPIIAAAPGEVITAGWNSGGYGKLVKVRHPDGSITLYAHNNRLLVRRGQKVEQGQQIAEMGSTGYSTGPHLHFEVHPSGTGAVNPVALLPKKRK
jgi:murein DD-endopeptidase MepM/ murein hydrolase activator NlpD